METRRGVATNFALYVRSKYIQKVGFFATTTEARNHSSLGRGINGFVKPNRSGHYDRLVMAGGSDRDGTSVLHFVHRGVEPRPVPQASEPGR